MGLPICSPNDMFTELPGREARSTYRGGLAARPHRCWHPSSPAASRNTASCRYPPQRILASCNAARRVRRDPGCSNHRGAVEAHCACQTDWNRIAFGGSRGCRDHRCTRRLGGPPSSPVPTRAAQLCANQRGMHKYNPRPRPRLRAACWRTDRRLHRLRPDGARSALMVRSVASRSTLAWEIARVRVALASISVKTQASGVVRSMSMPSPTTAVVSDQPARNSYRASNRLGHTRNDPVRVDVAPLVLDQCGSRRLIRTPATAAAASTAAPSRIHPALASPRTLR
jgi:hypothetical protein